MILHEYFQKFTLSSEDFDTRGNRKFPEDQGVETRGTWPYLPPKNCKRYGLKVQDLYESNDWLKMDGNPGEWAVAFHAVKSPETICENGKKVLESIMDGK